MKRWFVFLFILVLAPYILLSFAAHPSADDYAYANNTLNHGYWGGQSYFYTSWTGRYFATALIGLNGFLLEWPLFYRLFPAMVLGLLGVAAYRLIRITTGQLLRPREQVAAALGFMAILLSNFPVTAEGFYWWPGAATYTVPLIIATFSLLILVPHFQSMRQFSIADSLGLIAAAFVVIGCNETIMLLWLYMLSALMVWDWIRSRRVLLSRIVVLLPSLAFAATVILAPGNSVRTAYFEDSHRPLYSVFHTLIEVFSHAGQFLGVLLLAASVLLIWLIVLRLDDAAGVSKSAFRWTMVLFAGFMFASFFPAMWAMGEDPPDRVDNLVYYLFLWFWFLLVYQWGVLNRARMAVLLPSKPWLKPGVVSVVLAVGLVSGNNNYQAWYDLLFNAVAYDEANQARYRVYRISPGQDVVVAPIEPRARTIMFSELSVDPQDWINREVAQYYQLESVRRAD